MIKDEQWVRMAYLVRDALRALDKSDNTRGKLWAYAPKAGYCAVSSFERQCKFANHPRSSESPRDHRPTMRAHEFLKRRAASLQFVGD